MKFESASYSDIGGRPSNQDCVRAISTHSSFLGIVADGLGGHSKGEVASSEAVLEAISLLEGKELSGAALEDAIAAANARVYAHTAVDDMKTTIAVLWADDQGALVSTVGDTRVYQIRNGAVCFQSIDHSIARAEVDSGEMDVSEIRTSAYRHYLTRALGAADAVKPETVRLDIAPGDAFLICSDGVWEKVEDNEMAQSLLQSKTPAAWLEWLRRCVACRANGEGDNNSAIAVFVR